MRKYAAISALFHVAVFVIAWFGVPDLFRRDLPEDKPLIVEVLPISAITNAAAAEARAAEGRRGAEAAARAAEGRAAQARAAEGRRDAEAARAQAATAAAASAPGRSRRRRRHPPRCSSAEVPLPQPPKPRPEPPKPVKQAAPAEQPQKPQKQQAFDLNNMLRDLTRQKPQQQTTPPPAPQQQAQAAPRAASNAPHNPNIPLSMTEEDAIRQRIVQNWNLDIGAKGIETFFVELQLVVAPDGTVQDARVVRTQGDPADALRAFAEGARRAALRCVAAAAAADQGEPDDRRQPLSHLLGPRHARLGGRPAQLD